MTITTDSCHWLSLHPIMWEKWRILRMHLCFFLTNHFFYDNLVVFSERISMKILLDGAVFELNTCEHDKITSNASTLSKCAHFTSSFSSPNFILSEQMLCDGVTSRIFNSANVYFAFFSSSRVSSVDQFIWFNWNAAYMYICISVLSPVDDLGPHQSNMIRNEHYYQP